MIGNQPAHERTKEQVHHAVRQGSPWIELLGRIGYIAHGMIYALVGVLAAMAAFGAGGDTTDLRGALNWVIEAPLGPVLLGAVAVGLVGYTLWRLVQATLDPEHNGTGPMGILIRIGYAASGTIHLGLALSAVRLISGSGKDDTGDRAVQDWTAGLLTQPWGAWAIGVAGAIMLGVGVYQLYLACSRDLYDKQRLRELSSAKEGWLTALARLGFAARGVVFGIVGASLVVGAWQTRPDETRGIGGALATLGALPAGPGLLSIVGLGLLAYGLFKLAQAYYRGMRVA